MLKKLGILAAAAVVFSSPAFADAYTDCMKSASVKGSDFEIALCMKAEADRVLKQVQAEYTQLAADKDFEKWNNGNGMFKGNLRDMYAAWLNYRDKYCSLYAYAAERYAGSEDYNREKCRMDLTKEQLAYITAISKVHNSTIN